jgi:hypothetical protein
MIGRGLGRAELGRLLSAPEVPSTGVAILHAGHSENIRIVIRREHPELFLLKILDGLCP